MGNIVLSKDSEKDKNYFFKESQSIIKLNKSILAFSKLPSVIETRDELEHYDFCFERIINYLESSYVISASDFENETENSLQIEIPKIGKFKFSQSEFKDASPLHSDQETSPIVLIKLEANKKYLLKIININYDESKIERENLNDKDKVADENKIQENNLDLPKNPFQYYHNRDTFKELRILRNHPNLNIINCLGYYANHKDKKIYFVYDFFENSIRKVLAEESITRLESKITILKNILEIVKSLHCEGIISLNLSIDSFRFGEKGLLKICQFRNSLDVFSIYDIDRFSKIFKKRDIHFAPELIFDRLKDINWQSDMWSLGIIISMLFSDKIFELTEEISQLYENKRIPDSFYKEIKYSVHIQSIVIGLLRINHYERPNIFEVIDNFNNFIKFEDLTENYFIYYTKDEVLKFSKFFQKSTYLVLKESINNIYDMIEPTFTAKRENLFDDDDGDDLLDSEYSYDYDDEDSLRFLEENTQHRDNIIEDSSNYKDANEMTKFNSNLKEKKISKIFNFESEKNSKNPKENYFTFDSKSKNDFSNDKNNNNNTINKNFVEDNNSYSSNKLYSSNKNNNKVLNNGDIKLEISKEENTEISFN